MSSLLLPGLAAENIDPLRGFSAAETVKQRELEERYRSLTPGSERFRELLETLTRAPHPAGSAANRAVADVIANTMAKAGLEVERYPYEIYLPLHDQASASVALVTPERLPLNAMENVHPADPYSAHPDLHGGWNAYSASGEVTAPVVYANHARREDFEQLAEMGVEVAGKIVIARYGGNFRGYKEKYAADAGAVGLVIYSDPRDGGYRSGLEWPEGRHLDSSTIQRGSILTLPWTGDPLTPFEPAIPEGDPQRLDVGDVDLPTIPVTPLPWGSAREILERMQGLPAPRDWQGALPFTYRLTGGEELTVRLAVDQPHGMVTVENVVGFLRGRSAPDEWAVLGSHYDAWEFGAVDPNAGTAMLLLVAEALGQLASDGWQPERSIAIAHWDAEEFGIIGSAEWVEQFRDTLTSGGVLYLNADGAVSGGRVSSSAAPPVKQAIIDAMAVTATPSGESFQERWERQNGRELGLESFGNLGGGSDHVAFTTHIAMPAAGINVSSSAPIYHSAYDNFAWYEKHADTTFEHGPALARLDGTLALRFANATLIPYDLTAYAEDLDRHTRALEKQAGREFTDLRRAADRLRRATQATARKLAATLERPLSQARAAELNRLLLEIPRTLAHDDGMGFGPWYRSLWASPDPTSGYASWMLPGIRWALDQGTGVDTEEARLVRALDEMTARVRELNRRAGP